MRFLILIISLIFSYIFLVFSGIEKFSINSISGNLIIESILFFVVGFIGFLYFGNYKLGVSSGSINKEKIMKILSNFFKDYSYYMGFLLLYISLYIISYSLGYKDFSYIIFTANIAVIILFAFSYKFFIFRDFIKINIIIFSIYYLFFYIYFFFSGDFFSSKLDLLNSLIVLIFLFFNLYSDRKVLGYKVLDASVITYFFIYLFLSICFYSSKIIDEKLFIFTLFSFIFSFLIYNFFLKYKIFESSNIILKYIAVVFGYISMFFGILFTLIHGFNYIIILILLYFCAFNFLIHIKFQNYISLFFGLSGSLYIIGFLYFTYFHSSNYIFLEVSFLVSFILVLLTYIFKFKYYLDYYFFHGFGYMVNIFSIFTFFILNGFELLDFGIILLIESIFVFSSYFKLRLVLN